MIPSDLVRLYVRSSSGDVVSLENLVSIEEAVGPSEIPHFNRLRSATISSSVPPDTSLGEAISFLSDHVQGGIQALSRSYFSRFIPEGGSGEFFGFYNMLGRSRS